MKKSWKRKRKENLTAFVFLLPSLCGVIIFTVFPFADVIKRSFYNAMNFEFVGIKNYKTILQNGAFQLAVTNTVHFFVVCIPLLFILSLIISVMLFSIKKYREFIKTTFLIPMAIPTASIVLLWKIFFHNYGLFNKMVDFLGGTTTDLLNTSSAFYVLVFTYVWKNIGYDIVLWISGLNNISADIYEAAAMDGAGKIRIFFSITLPNLISTFFIVMVLSLINAFKVFREIYLIAGNYPNQSIYMLQHLFNNWFLALDIQKLCAAAVLVGGILLIFIIILKKITEHSQKEI